MGGDDWGFLLNENVERAVGACLREHGYRADHVVFVLEPGVDEATRDAWVAETDNQSRERLDTFETGDAQFSEEARVAYDEDVSAIEAAVAAVATEDAT